MKNELKAAVEEMALEMVRAMQSDGGFAAHVAEAAQRTAQMHGYDP